MEQRTEAEDLMTHVWFLLPDGSEVASDVTVLPRRGEVVRFGSDGPAYEVVQVEFIATTARPRFGVLSAKIVMRLSAVARPAA
jgi:hypothetical protein